MSSRKHRRSSFDDTNARPNNGDAAITLMKAVLHFCSGAAWKWNEHLTLQEGLLRRCAQMEAIDKDSKFLRQLILSKDQESGYTALHEAVYAKDLAKILLLLRYASDTERTRLTRRPMELLYGNGGSTLVREMACAKDNEGMTPAALLASFQQQSLAECRQHLDTIKYQQYSKRDCGASNFRYDRTIDDVLGNEEEDSVESIEKSGNHAENNVTYGCEVFTFGRAHHCALGVVMSDKNRKEKEEKLRPQRVQAFAHDTVGKLGSAVAAAAATYHTLVATARGELFAFGLGKGFRLGTGNEKPCATPVRVEGPLLREKVVGVAAAENHSICVAASGHVYTFGSNGFGQLGYVSDKSVTGLPRKVDDLKHVFCIAVAAGTKHSVFLSQNGEVFVCGDNSDGQLSFSKRSGSSCFHKVQRVDALWKADSGPKKAIAISASECSSMALISGSEARGLPLNTIYCWGHGNHIPCRVKFDAVQSSRPINPVAIACARYHNVALSSDGRVYSWGLRADSLGTVSGQRGLRRGNTVEHEAFSRPAFTDPQLVSGMLRENGGGFAVAVSASENHTAIVTATGSLYTFGDTYKPNIMGHEGVRWQPEPKRVPGVHQAVGVSASKEHIVLLIATIFPEIPRHLSHISARNMSTLEEIVGTTVAEHVDLFNAIPILAIAERTRTPHLLRYCKEFIKMNLEGVLNEQLLDSSGFPYDHAEVKDDACHPLVRDVVFAGSLQKTEDKNGLIDNLESWFRTCELVLSRHSTADLVKRICSVSANSLGKTSEGESSMHRSSSISEASNGFQSPESKHQKGLCSPRCEELTTDINFSSVSLAEARYERLSKEIRSIRKRLTQISKLERDRTSGSTRLTEEQNSKIARKAQLEADLLVFEPALEIIEEKLRILRISENNALDLKDTIFSPVVHHDIQSETKLKVEHAASSGNSFRCDTCQVTCPDNRSYELHLRGRKHRNRLTNRAEEEQKIAAASILADQHRKIVLAAEQPQSNETKIISSASDISPWGKKPDAKTSHLQPEFKLPPPPHEVAEFVVRPTVACLGGRRTSDGFEQEMSKSREHDVLPTTGSPAVKSFREIMAEEEENRKRQSIPMKQNYKTKPAKESSSSKVSSKTIYPTAIVSRASSLSGSQKGMESTQQSRLCAWSIPQNADTRSNMSVTLRDIQDQEMSLKVKQDRSILSGGRWFVQQRDRAGSFKDIQHETERLSEEQRFIEEQINIEKQIYEEIAARKAAQNRTSQGKKPNYHKKGKQNTSKNKSGEKEKKTDLNIQVSNGTNGRRRR